MAKSYYFIRKLRTACSERYDVVPFSGGGDPIATCDIHYKTNDEAYLTLVLYRNIAKDDINELIKELDDDVLEVADIDKGNLFVRTFEAKELAGFNVDKEWTRPKFSF